MEISIKLRHTPLLAFLRVSEREHKLNEHFNLLHTMGTFKHKMMAVTIVMSGEIWPLRKASNEFKNCLKYRNIGDIYSPPTEWRWLCFNFCLPVSHSVHRTLLAFTANSAAQSSAQTYIHSAIVVIDTSNNAWHSQVHWLAGTPYLAVKASNGVAMWPLPIIHWASLYRDPPPWFWTKKLYKYIRSLFWTLQTPDPSPGPC